MTPATVKLVNPIQHYTWGSVDAIATLQGRPAPTSEPEAELWIGDHPAAPSRVVEGDGTTDLPAWIARDPDSVLGVGSEHLPFLVKVLAAQQSLSVQVHPDAEQAKRGFTRESAAGVAADERSYPDPAAKHEVLIALSRFEALAGFREDTAAAGLIEGIPSDVLARLVSDVAAEPVPLAAGLFHRLQRIPERERHTLAEDLGVWARQGNSWETRATAQLLSEHPNDPLALVPLLLNPVALRTGEALVIQSGTVHTYLSGIAVEVMTRSDNVVRGGLTAKYRDPEELAVVTVAQPAAPEIVAPRLEGAGVASYWTGTEAFAVRTLELCGGSDGKKRPGGAVVVVLCVEGAVEIGPMPDSTGACVTLGSGEAALVPACVECYRLVGAARTSKVFEVSTR